VRLAVFGATGGIGRLLVRQALTLGHQVTAVVRDPARLPVRAGRLEVVVADPFDAAAIAPVLAEHDAVLSALGPRPGGPSTVCSRGAAAITEAMRHTGVRRLVIVSASGPFTERGDDPLTRFVVKPIVQRLLRATFTDLRTAEETVRGSGLDWTIVRPARLTDRPATGRARSARDRGLPLGLFTSRADVAAEMLRAVDDPAGAGHHVTLAS
jgi:putative NADH-flavin reductase